MAAARYLRGSVVAQPLVGRWYAWPHLVPPHTAARLVARRHVPVLRSYLDAPDVHDTARRDPRFYGGPFVAAGDGGPAQVRALLDETLVAQAPLVALDDAIADAFDLLAAKADGGPLGPLHRALAPPLRGRVELVYDAADQPGIRFVEPLLYRGPAWLPATQSLSLLAAPDPAQPFTMGGPVLPSPARLDVDVPFADPAVDGLLGARRRAVVPAALAEQLGIGADAAAPFERLFTAGPPPPPVPPPAGAVRVRWFGHACVAVEHGTTAVVLDPLVGYDGDGHDHHTVADLPPAVDAVVVTHAHPDHASIEGLLQLRSSAATVVVPAGGGSVVDPSLRLLLGAVGFRHVDELGDGASVDLGAGARVTTLPFVGEHADLDIRAKGVQLVEMGGRRLLFATDVRAADPAFVDELGAMVGPVDALFVGMECDGAPLSWLYGPLLAHRPGREADQARRLAGPDADEAWRLATAVAARRVHVYAMGTEPWLRHVTATVPDESSRPSTEARALVERCRAAGVTASVLHGREELLL